MADPPRPLEHQDPERKSDEALRKEARDHLAARPPLQLVAELLIKLRSLDLSWWRPDALRTRWSATDRMRWLRARPDLRQRVTSSLTGLGPRAARKKEPDFQGALIDAVIDEGDVSVRAFEEAFDPCDLAVYGPADEIWRAFIERMPWADDTPAHQELWAWVFDALLADQSSIDGLHRKPILTAWDARTSIDGRVWHTRMPLEIRVAIDEARFQKERERPSEPFHTGSDLSIAVSATIAASIPLRDLAPVFATAERAMGFARAPGTGPGTGRSAPEATAATASAGSEKKADAEKKADGARRPELNAGNVEAQPKAAGSNGAAAPAGSATAPAGGAARRPSIAPAPLSAPPPAPLSASPPGSPVSPSVRPAPLSASPPPLSASPSPLSASPSPSRSQVPPAMSGAARSTPSVPPAAAARRSEAPLAMSRPVALAPIPPPPAVPAIAAPTAAAPHAHAETRPPSRSFHDIGGEELEHTNPWDIVHDEPSVGDETTSTKVDAHAAGDVVSTKRRRAGKG